MSKRLGNRLAIWGCVTVLACSSALLPGAIFSNELRTGDADGGWQLPYSAVTAASARPDASAPGP
ncbi:hypothetical protein, partial [Paenibacillus sp. tmac-D7]